MSSFLIGLAVAAAVSGLSAPSNDVARERTSPVAPLTVIRPFEASAPYGPGHRGVDLAAVVGQPVRSVRGGRITVAGTVAGRTLVVVDHGDGLRTTYLPVRPAVRVGDQVPPGHRLGWLAGPAHCSGWPSCLHLGARRGSTYVDPLALLRGRTVLLPLS